MSSVPLHIDIKGSRAVVALWQDSKQSDMFNFTKNIIQYMCRLVVDLRHKTRRLIPCTCTFLPSLVAYIENLVTHLQLDDWELLYAAIYLQRLQPLLARTGLVQPCTPFRQCLAAMIAAHKFLHDHAYKNVYWCAVSTAAALTITNSEINKAERQILKGLHWDLKVSGEEVRSALSAAISLQRKPCLKREDATLGSGHSVTGYA